MSFVSERGTDILKQLKEMRERQTAANQSAMKSSTIDELCYLPSPLNLESIWRADLDREMASQRDLLHGSPTLANQLSKKKGGEAQKKVAVQNFAVAKDLTQYTFEKCAPEAAAERSAQSELTAAVKKMMKESRPIHAAKPVMRTLNVHLPTLETITIQVGDKTAIEDVIKVAMQQYEIECSEKKRQVRINLNPKAYVLRFAEDDGAPDEDLPALVKTQEIGNFRGKDFALCPDTSFKVMKSTTNMTETTIPKVPLFKVFLPNEEGFVSVAYEPQTTLQNVMELVAKKRALDAQQYEFEFYEGDGANAKGDPHNMNEVLGQLGVGRLQLIEKKKLFGHRRNPSGKIITAAERRASVNLSKDTLRGKTQLKDLSGDASKPITKRVGPVYFYTPITAIKYQEFPVVKYNKFGVKQERTMGIDEQKLTNLTPEKTKSNSNNKVKRPERPIKEITRAWVSTTRPNQFYIEFKDQTYKYESAHAEEIIAKLNYLLNMYEEDRQRTEKVNT